MSFLKFKTTNLAVKTKKKSPTKTIRILKIPTKRPKRRHYLNLLLKMNIRHTSNGSQPGLPNNTSSADCFADSSLRKMYPSSNVKMIFGHYGPTMTVSTGK